MSLTALLAVACSKGSPPAASAPATGGVALPKEISALPPKPQTALATAGASALRMSAFRDLGRALTVSSLPAGSDYGTASTVKWVNEQALSRFDILNSIFKAIGQTNYADPANVGAGPYGANVTSVGDGGGDGAQQKALQTWVVDSTVATEGGQPVNVLHCWIADRGGLVTAVLKVYRAPAQNADGSYSDYGVWTIDADLSPDGSQYFVASAELGPDGASIVKVHNTDGGGGGGGPLETRGIMHKSGAAGYGKVSFFDQNCGSSGCQPQPVTVAYAYDAHHVKMALTKGGQTETLFKDRDTVVDLVERYGLYDSGGADVAKSRHFGFPFRYGANGGSWGYYGAWQGRHQIWANGETVAAGVTVTRGDRGPDQPTETYTTSRVYPGILVKRSYVGAALDDIKDVVVGAWDFQSFTLVGTGAAWQRCVMSPPPAPGMPAPQPVCDPGTFTGFADLVADPAIGTQVDLASWSSGMGTPSTRTTLGVNATRDGLVDATGAAFLPTLGTQVGVNASGPIWIAYTGSGWVKKQVVSIDPTTHQPTFGPGDTAYAIPDGREYYLDNMGVRYVVSCSGGACTAKLENQAVANPANVAALVPAGTVFTQPSWGATPSTYTLVTDPADPSFMELVYLTVGQQDLQQHPTAVAGGVVTSGQWGLSATIGGTQVQFNWEYPDASGACTTCGTQQFLLDAGGQIVQLDDPIRLAAMDLVNGAGEHHRYSMQFDGSWVSGLPDLHADLQAAGYQITPAIQAKAVAIPTGTVVTDAADASRQYVFKQLQVSEYLATAADPGGLDLAAAGALDLSTVPAWVATGLGARPPFVLKYSEGNPVK
ncbi:hypothetical protein AMYX_00360 [Anaeromyxobacter diazotrophicus]|uniref:Uncharacterized protein n=1 Tax=Anaeromyxobacter diazotrophicus TaxID=2590199 RepID=A0A7I9VG22_9BACT|nr:hypothetical protein AMYX_00360 [Anaeromyxobacter diazotrophicus]